MAKAKNKRYPQAILNLIAEKSAVLSKAQTFVEMGMPETAQPLWASAASYEERLAPLLEGLGEERAAAVHRISAASCYQKAGDPSRAINLYRAALAGPLREATRRDVQRMLSQCLSQLAAEKAARTANEKAARTAKWAITMTRWLISRLKCKTTWNLVTFTGPNGGESVGIVDILAIRKNHRVGENGLKRGDVFDIILMQVKGGGAKWPTWNDIQRLEKVGRIYSAKAVLLAEWKKGRQPVLYKLKETARHQPDAKVAWEKMDRPLEMFG